jgi:hypothetical protein
MARMAKNLHIPISEKAMGTKVKGGEIGGKLAVLNL